MSQQRSNGPKVFDVSAYGLSRRLGHTRLSLAETVAKVEAFANSRDSSDSKDLEIRTAESLGACFTPDEKQTSRTSTNKIEETSDRMAQSVTKQEFMSNKKPVTSTVNVSSRESAEKQVILSQRPQKSEHPNAVVDPTLEVAQPSTPTQADHSTGLRTVRQDIRVKMPSASKDKDGLNSDERLQQLRDEAFQNISRKLASKKRDKSKLDTTSLRDLDLARAPVNPKRPNASRRRWAEDSPVTQHSLGEEYMPARSAQEKVTRVTELSSDLAVKSPLPQNVQAAVPLLASSKWAANDEMKDEKYEDDENAWGSANPSDATKASNLSDENFGKLFQHRTDSVQDSQLVNWEGNMVVPPADWHDRPKYNNNNPVFRARFEGWLGDVRTDAKSKGRFSNGVALNVVSSYELGSIDNHPNGIGMIKITNTISPTNAAHYGYTDDPEDALKYAAPLDPVDLTKWDKLDKYDINNQTYRHETTEDLVSNWLKHLGNTRNARIDLGHTLQQQDLPDSTQDAGALQPTLRSEPKLNIYLRPATSADLEELTRIYNWYIENEPLPSETELIRKSQMRERLELAKEGKLPFIVAALKNQRRAKPIPDIDEDELQRRTNLPVTHKKHMTLTKVETLAGFCCANDLTAPDFVEHISAELEIYVDPARKKQGVGRCLIDKMLEICDRGHIRTMNFDFHCDQTIRHLYSQGGGRDVHKLYILLRKWHSPKPVAINIEKGRRFRKSAFMKKGEAEYDKWLKKWLESWGFEVEGCLKKIGAKHKRYLDLVYLGRETAWQPPDGQVPDPDPMFSHGGHDEDEEDEADD